MCFCVQTFKLTDRLFVGLSGLASDIQTLEQLLRFRLNLYKLREEREIKAETFSALLSHMLYEKRWGDMAVMYAPPQSPAIGATSTEV